MALFSKVGIGLGSTLLGIVIGIAVSRGLTEVQRSNEAKAIPMIDYENTLLNALSFQVLLDEQPNVDSLFAQNPAYSRSICVVRNDSLGLEALAIPPAGGNENYYLIRGDSVTQLWVRPRQIRCVTCVP